MIYFYTTDIFKTKKDITRIFLEKKKKKGYTTDTLRTQMHFLRVNVTFYEGVNVIYDVIKTANPFSHTAKFKFVCVRNNKTQQIIC